MSSYVHLVLLVLLAIIPATTGYNTGAPTTACVDMSPIHGADPQPTVSPYSLEVDRHDISGSNTLKVCVKGKAGERFIGILLQMRVVGNTDPVGTFNGTRRLLANGTKLINCTVDEDTVTHSRGDQRDSHPCFTWIAPDNDVPNNLHFVATIVKTQKEYWVNVTSDVINAPTTTTATTTTATTTAATSGVTASGVVFTTFAVCSLLAVVARLL